jgi:hypothetical protein
MWILTRSLECTGITFRSCGSRCDHDLCAERLLCRYLVILDDDVFFTSATRLEVLLDTLEAQPQIHVAAGSYTQYDSHKSMAEVNDYSLLFEATTEPGHWRAYQPLPPLAGECHRVHASHNFFMARTDTLRRYPWHPKLSIFEHEHFFFQLYLAEQARYVSKRVLYTPTRHILFTYRQPPSFAM